MYVFSDSEKVEQIPEFRLDMALTIREAIRAMIDNREYDAVIVDPEGEILSVVKVKDLNEALRLGHSSSTTLQQIILSKIVEKMFS